MDKYMEKQFLSDTKTVFWLLRKLYLPADAVLSAGRPHMLRQAAFMETAKNRERIEKL